MAAAAVLLPTVPGATRAMSAITTRSRTENYYKDWGSKKLRETILAGAQALAKERIATVALCRRLEAQGLTRTAWSRRWASYLMTVNE